MTQVVDLPRRGIRKGDVVPTYRLEKKGYVGTMRRGNETRDVSAPYDGPEGWEETHLLAVGAKRSVREEGSAGNRCPVGRVG